MSGHRRFQKTAIQNNCIGLIFGNGFTTGDFRQRKYWTCSTTKPRAFGNWPKWLANGFGFSLTSNRRAISPPHCLNLVSIGTANASFGSTLAGSLCPPPVKTRAKNITPISRQTGKPLERKHHERTNPIVSGIRHCEALHLSRAAIRIQGNAAPGMSNAGEFEVVRYAAASGRLLEAACSLAPVFQRRV